MWFSDALLLMCFASSLWSSLFFSHLQMTKMMQTLVQSLFISTLTRMKGGVRGV